MTSAEERSTKRMTRQVSDRDGAGKHADAPAVKLKERPEVDKRETHERGTEEGTRMQTRRQKRSGGHSERTRDRYGGLPWQENRIN